MASITMSTSSFQPLSLPADKYRGAVVEVLLGFGKLAFVSDALSLETGFATPTSFLDLIQ